MEDGSDLDRLSAPGPNRSKPPARPTSKRCGWRSARRRIDAPSGFTVKMDGKSHHPLQAGHDRPHQQGRAHRSGLGHRGAGAAAALEPVAHGRRHRGTRTGPPKPHEIAAPRINPPFDAAMPTMSPLGTRPAGRRGNRPPYNRLDKPPGTLLERPSTSSKLKPPGWFPWITIVFLPTRLPGSRTSGAIASLPDLERSGGGFPRAISGIPPNGPRDVVVWWLQRLPGHGPAPQGDRGDGVVTATRWALVGGTRQHRRNQSPAGRARAGAGRSARQGGSLFHLRLCVERNRHLDHRQGFAASPTVSILSDAFNHNSMIEGVRQVAGLPVKQIFSGTTT